MSLRGILKLVYDRLLRKEFPMLKEGDRAPKVELPDQSGEQRRLADYRGKYVVLWFFPKANTAG